MEKVLNFVFILLLSSGSISSNDETSIVPLHFSPEFEIIYQTVDRVCSSIDECKLECCSLNEMYSIAKRNCSTDIDMQLSEVNLNSVLSADHKLSCESVCKENNLYNNSRMENEVLKTVMHIAISDGDKFCHNFSAVCLFYSTYEDNFEHLISMDYFSRFWLPLLGVGLSITFMSFTLILYLAVPELCHRIQDKCFLFHLSFQIVSLIMYFVVLFSPFEAEDFSCKLSAFLIQFSDMSAVFWLNIICYHLWRCINSTVSVSQLSTRTICYYSLYACGFSFLLTALTLSADFWLPDEYNSYKPHIGEYCTIKGYDEYVGPSKWLQPKFIYSYSIKIVIQIINFVAFLHITYIISSKEKFFRKKENATFRRHQMQQLGFLTYVKLFLLMGLTTIMEIIFYHFGRTPLQKMSPTFVSAFIFFVIFVCNKRVFHLTKKRFSQLKSSQSSLEYRRIGCCALIFESTSSTKLDTVE